MGRSDLNRDPERVVDAPDTESYQGTSHWVCDVNRLEVNEVTDPDQLLDPVLSADSLRELLGKVRYAKETGQLSEYAADHFQQHIIAEIKRQ